jgi:hypothetical protein
LNNQQSHDISNYVKRQDEYLEKLKQQKLAPPQIATTIVKDYSKVLEDFSRLDIDSESITPESEKP